MEILISLGLALSFIMCFVIGCVVTLNVGRHFVDNYVEKMTPEKLKELDDMAMKDAQDNYNPLDEALWARGMTRAEVNTKDEMED